MHRPIGVPNRKPAQYHVKPCAGCTNPFQPLGGRDAFCATPACQEIRRRKKIAVNKRCQMEKVHQVLARMNGDGTTPTATLAKQRCGCGAELETHIRCAEGCDG